MKKETGNTRADAYQHRPGWRVLVIRALVVGAVLGLWLMILIFILLTPSNNATLAFYLGSTAVVLLLFWTQTKIDLLQWLYYLRAPLGLAILIAVFPILAFFTAAEALLKNLFVQNGYQAFVTVVLTYLALEVTKKSARYIHHGGEIRFGYTSNPDKIGRWPRFGRVFENFDQSKWGLLFPMVFSLPIVIALLTQATDCSSAVIGTLGGIAASLAIIVLYAQGTALIHRALERRKSERNSSRISPKKADTPTTGDDDQLIYKGKRLFRPVAYKVEEKQAFWA